MVELNKVCGVDVHRDFLAVTILDRSGERLYREFGTDVDSLLAFKDWVVSNECERAAFESTGVYWTPVYDVLEGYVEGKCNVFCGNFFSSVAFFPIYRPLFGL